MSSFEGRHGIHQVDEFVMRLNIQGIRFGRISEVTGIMRGIHHRLWVILVEPQEHRSIGEGNLNWILPPGTIVSFSVHDEGTSHKTSRIRSVTIWLSNHSEHRYRPAAGNTQVLTRISISYTRSRSAKDIHLWYT
jgi:hypothetical protein